MRHFLWGALAMTSVIASIFFMRYFRLTRDRLFVYFSIAFLAMALNWIGLAIADPSIETRHQVYVLRLLAFVLILIGIIDKNRRGKPF
jgi:Ca2+/Na+ antiporter